MEKNLVKIYVTKYWLTTGIYPTMAEPIDGGKYYSVPSESVFHSPFLSCPRDCSPDLPTALNRILEQSKRKKASVARTLKKIDDMLAKVESFAKQAESSPTLAQDAPK